jgi:CRP/FNR family transcriptional regulator, dissimilatory nitrate respiration regulator
MVEKKLKSIDIFKNIDEKELQTIASITSIKNFYKENIIFYEGDKVKYFYALLEGSVKIYKTGFKNNEIVLHYFNQPTLIAEMAALENIPFPATAISLDDATKIALIDKKKFQNLLCSDATLSCHIMGSLTKKIKNLEQTINRNLIFDAITKVCSLIKENPCFLQEHKNLEIASILNMAPETLSRVLSKLKKVGVLNKENLLIDEEKLTLYLEI